MLTMRNRTCRRPPLQHSRGLRPRHQRNRNCSCNFAWLPNWRPFYFSHFRNILYVLRCPIHQALEEHMFQETLLESSPTSPRRRRWPMATAFTFQLLVASVLVAVPLLSAGVIPLTSSSMPVPISYDKPAAEPHDKRPAGGPAAGRPVHGLVIGTMSGAYPILPWRAATRGKDSPDP